MILTQALKINHMFVTKCDICRKQIKNYNQEIRVVTPGKLLGLAFCLNCGKPVTKFLEKYRLVENQTDKTLN
jgi:hypothetical protein